MSASRGPLLLLLTVLYINSVYTSTMPRQFESRLNDEVTSPKKRPFCNAFTGCGRKRSLTPSGIPVQEYIRQRPLTDDDGTWVDPEMAIEELSRQILSEAKLWEAIQDAAAEIARRKQKENGFN